MDSVAVVLPAHEPRFDGSRRDAVLTTHAAQLARIGSQSMRVRVFAADAFEMHDLLARLAAFRPARIVVEHSPLAYDHASGVPIAIASWGKARSVPVALVAHAEFARVCDPPENAVANGLMAAGPVLAQCDRIICHESAWARVIGERFRSCVERLELVDAWPIFEPPSVVPVDASAPRLVLVDDVGSKPLTQLTNALRGDGATYRYVTLFRSAALPAMEAIAAGEGAELAQLFVESSLVVIPESRHIDETKRWIRTALAFGRRVMVVKPSGEVEEIERPAETTWSAIAHSILSRENDRALAVSLEEDVEKPPIGIRESR